MGDKVGYVFVCGVCENIVWGVVLYNLVVFYDGDVIV